MPSKRHPVDSFSSEAPTTPKRKFSPDAVTLTPGTLDAAEVARNADEDEMSVSIQFVRDGRIVSHRNEAPQPVQVRTPSEPMLAEELVPKQPPKAERTPAPASKRRSTLVASAVAIVIGASAGLLVDPSIRARTVEGVATLTHAASTSNVEPSPATQVATPSSTDATSNGPEPFVRAPATDAVTFQPSASNPDWRRRDATPAPAPQRPLPARPLPRAVPRGKAK